MKSAAVADNMEDTVTGASLSAVKVAYFIKSSQTDEYGTDECGHVLIVEQISAEHVLIVEQIIVEYKIKLKHRCGGSFASALDDRRYLEI